MPLPKIAPYSMPLPPPESRARWRSEPARTALLVHDMQNYFVGAFPRDASPARELTANAARLCEAARSLRIPIFYSAQPGDQSPSSRALLADFWGPGLSSAPEHQDIVAELSPRGGADEVMFAKHRYSAFQRTDLLAMLRQRGRDQLAVCGVYAHLGCLLTACEAFMCDIQPFFVADAVADFSPELHRMALEYAAGRFGVALTTDDLVAAWRTAPGPLTLSLRAEVAELLGDGDPIGDEESLLDRGLDSIRLMTMVERLQQRGANVTFGDLAADPTLLAWASLLGTRTRPAAPQ